MTGLEGSAELILVDDGSADGTAEHAVALAEDFPHRTVVVRLGRNFGQHAAVVAGFQQARGQVVVRCTSTRWSSMAPGAMTSCSR
jgi:undecaprenyl-phosphate 4-deoxy-4-formamido-L-arabinose transferase